MLCIAVAVYIGLGKITAGYGMMYTKSWGASIPNRIGWVVMEAPAFIAMLLLWVLSPRAGQIAPAIMAALFEVHYFQRSFIFPLLIRGKNRMPWSIILMGVVFNTINAYMIGGWLFWVSPADTYPVSWLWSPLFILGAVVFLTGMLINLHSDYIIRHLRKPGDTAHYIPRGGMYNYVTSANYFGELTEWTGYAILTWSLGGLAFVIWTFANLAPRAVKIHHRYVSEFGAEYTKLNRKYLIPFIY
ncbi:MAG: DUF1295 domain-containing protein [Muribaculaceae bacterium]|nr:DUF1295 domain-containing protein [Muribaculaceae bacterium]